MQLRHHTPDSTRYMCAALNCFSFDVDGIWQGHLAAAPESKLRRQHGHAYLAPASCSHILQQHQHPNSKEHTPTPRQHPATAPTHWLQWRQLAGSNPHAAIDIQHPSSKAHTAIDMAGAPSYKADTVTHMATAPCSGTSAQVPKRTQTTLRILEHLNHLK